MKLRFLKNYTHETLLSKEFSHSLTPHNRIHAIVIVRGLTLDLTLEFINRVTTLPLGIAWRKEGKAKS